MAIGPVSGSAINPAVWLGTVLSATMCVDELKYIEYAWIYWVAHLSAGIIAGLWFNVVYGGDECDGIGVNGVTYNDIKEKKQLNADISDDDHDQ